MENQKRGRGRPKGSKNKVEDLNKSEVKEVKVSIEAKPKGKRGRPKGSKNKSTTKNELNLKSNSKAQQLVEDKKEINNKKAMAKNGEDYRQTARRMREEFGYKMNHVSVRNYTIRALEKIAYDLIDAIHSNDLNRKNYDVHEIVQYPLFQEGIAELMRIEE